MTILALEFSSDRRSVALARDGVVLAEAVEQTAGRGTKAFTLIEQVLAEAKTAREAVQLVAVGLGPGSYTGIRAAIAIAQGWHLATGVELRGVSSAEALAFQAREERIFGRVNVVIDAQRGEFYLATWEIGPDFWRESAGLKIVAATEIEALKQRGEVVVGPQVERQFFPKASALASLAAQKLGNASTTVLEPIYLRETAFVKASPPRIVV